MQGERDEGRDTAKENPVGRDSAKNEYGEIGERAGIGGYRHQWRAGCPLCVRALSLLV